RLLRIGHRAEDGNALEVLALFFGIYAGDVARLAVRIGAAHLRVELSGLAGDALGHHPRVLVDENAHFFFFAFLAFFTVAVFFFDSRILKAAVTFSAVAPPPTSRKFAGEPP